MTKLWFCSFFKKIPNSKYCSSPQMSGPISAQMQDSRDMSNKPTCWKGEVILFNPGFLRMCSNFFFFLKLVGFCFQCTHRCLSLACSSLLTHHSLDASCLTFPLHLPPSNFPALPAPPSGVALSSHFRILIHCVFFAGVGDQYWESDLCPSKCTSYEITIAVLSGKRCNKNNAIMVLSLSDQNKFEDKVVKIKCWK